MFRRILIANRGEIAQRIIRACKELDIETVAVYSEADADALYLRQADETICIGKAASSSSYLDIPSIISAAEIADVEAIHPGYGFLAENAHFAEVCRSCQIDFIGPSAETIAAVGNKARAREIAMGAKVPVVPGSDGPVRDEAEAVRVAQEIGYPILIKASSGGGGRGMRVASNEPSMKTGFRQAQAEAKAAFGDDTVYLEKYVERPRHIEVQILGDQVPATWCTWGSEIARSSGATRKLIEEAPSPSISAKLRDKMCSSGYPCGQGRRVPQRGHGGILGGQGRQLLLHRGQRARAGGAHGDRDDDRGGYHPAADPPGFRRKPKPFVKRTSCPVDTSSNAASTRRTRTGTSNPHRG